MCGDLILHKEVPFHQSWGKCDIYTQYFKKLIVICGVFLWRILNFVQKFGMFEGRQMYKKQLVPWEKAQRQDNEVPKDKDYNKSRHDNCKLSWVANNNLWVAQY